jgi:hypothetical protein
MRAPLRGDFASLDSATTSKDAAPAGRTAEWRTQFGIMPRYGVQVVLQDVGRAARRRSSAGAWRPDRGPATAGDLRPAGELPEVARLAQRHKHAFRDRLVATAAEAGAADPESLGRQLAVIFEGANALAASSNDVEAFTDARRAAKTLLGMALTTTPEG